ncbi:MAG TPA: ABC transporter permease [Actinomycetota bacterium]
MSAVTWAVARRSLVLIPRLPSTFVPSMVMPIFFTIVFSEGFRGLANLPGFPARETVDWFVPMSAIMGAGFAGITLGMGVARDLEGGFYDRLLSSPAPRPSLITGSLMAAAARSLLPFALVMVVGVLMGASFAGGVVPSVGLLLVAATGVSMITAGWSVAIALRLKTQQSAPLMQVGFFLLMFLSTLQMPLNLLTGWLHDVARINPMTQVLDLARAGFLDLVSWGQVWPGLVALAGMLVVLVGFAARSLQKVIP